MMVLLIDCDDGDTCLSHVGDNHDGSGGVDNNNNSDISC